MVSEFARARHRNQVHRRHYPVRAFRTHYQVLYDNRWLMVPTEAVSEGPTIPPETVSPAANATTGPTATGMIVAHLWLSKARRG